MLCGDWKASGCIEQPRALEEFPLLDAICDASYDKWDYPTRRPYNDLDFQQEAHVVPRYLILSALFALSCGVFSSAQGAVVYDESVAGDLSNSGSSPTVVHVRLGSNFISGSTGFGAAGIDRDYFSVTVPSGVALSSLTVLPGTSVGGDVSFIGVQVGSQVTVATDASTAAGLLGWMHYGEGNVNRDILPRIGTGEGATGFTGPLGPGTYSFWVQDFDNAPVTYDFDLTLTAAVAVPEPEMYVTLAIGLVFLIAGLRHRRIGN